LIAIDTILVLGFDKIPWWGDIILSLGLGAIAAVGVQVFAVGRIRKLVLNSNGKATVYYTRVMQKSRAHRLEVRVPEKSTLHGTT